MFRFSDDRQQTKDSKQPLRLCGWINKTDTNVGLRWALGRLRYGGGCGLKGANFGLRGAGWEKVIEITCLFGFWTRVTEILGYSYYQTTEN